MTNNNNDWQKELREKQKLPPHMFLSWLRENKARIPIHTWMTYMDLAQARTLNIRKNYDD